MPREHLLNADFDLSLRPRWRPPVGGKAQHRITDLAWHALFLAEPGDSVLVPESAPEDFLAYLGRSGIEPPALTVEPGIRKEQQLAPFGWNTETARRNGSYDFPAEHPPLDTIARVNGRRFSALLEDDLFGSGPLIAELTSETELTKRVQALPDSPSGWVIKSEHGNAGLGNRRLRTRDLLEGDLKVICRFFDEDDSVVLEQWQPRLRDLCATFDVSGDGGCEGFSLHEMFNTADGALIGSLFREDPAPLDLWRPEMDEAAHAVAGRLSEAGYFGPVCIDAFVWDDHGRQRLRPLVDLNARREISAGASALWRRLGGRGSAYWRFFNRRKLRLPDNYRDIERALGEDAYDPTTRAGVLVTAPLWLGTERRAPAKTATLMFGADRATVMAMDLRLRERFER